MRECTIYMNFCSFTCTQTSRIHFIRVANSGEKKEPNSVHMIDARVPKLSDQLHSLFFLYKNVVKFG